ncbi:hypothetical protein Ppa06_13770 [Planomonospora parontospora subsp. parontospora]|uniref:Uncharacterized protein n=2 Tax=Planomonospora parontospora TaxID=58119 RepID=A0AA37BD98_9ACTN|nr:hypothetical protein [Planomonospora parontospora]GGK53885.1 hypothetical protein GCM10010126_11800 [Planomonospora parontospora]GII07579.1 hypothetical protein Ppa06_13770 [Planomonospora parontospora subsp. parontospora]
MPGTSAASSSSPSAPPASPPQAARRAPARLTAYSLPLHTFRVFGACALSLVLWFSAGRAVRAALMWAGTELAHGDYRQVRLVVTTLIFTLIVLNELVVMVGMLHSVRGALREIRVRRAEDEGADESLFGALNRTTLLFATIYLAWSFHREDAQEFISLDSMKQISEDFGRVAAGGEGEAGTILLGLDLRISVGIAVAAYILKTLFAWLHMNGRVRGGGMLTAFFELGLAFYGLNALFALAASRADWLDERAAVAAVKGWFEDLEKTLPWWKGFWEGAGDLWPLLVDALIEPLAWLAVAALVYGAFAEDTRAVVRGTRLETVADRVERTHALTRTTMSGATTGFRDRWVPPVNAFRLAARGGAPLFGVFCLCYVALQVGADYAGRGVRALIGNDFPFFWLLFSSPVEFVVDLIAGVLTVCLLAAAFDVAATRSREAGQALTA